MSIRPTTPHQKYFKIRPAAAYTGLSIYTLRDLVASGDLPAYRVSDKPGAAYLFKIGDLDALMKPVIPDAVYADSRGGAK